MYRIITFFFLLALLSVQPTQAAGLRDDLLRIHANLLPKTLLMDYNFEQKLVKNSIVIDLVCNKIDHYSADKLKQYIHEKYPDGINKLPITVRIILYSDSAELQTPASLYYLLPANPEQIRQALQVIPVCRLVFAYDPSFLQYGAHIGLNIGRRIKPILNVDALKADDITLRQALVRISEMYYMNVSPVGLTN